MNRALHVAHTSLVGVGDIARALRISYAPKLTSDGAANTICANDHVSCEDGAILGFYTCPLSCGISFHLDNFLLQVNARPPLDLVE